MALAAEQTPISCRLCKNWFSGRESFVLPIKRSGNMLRCVHTIPVYFADNKSLHRVKMQGGESGTGKLFPRINSR